MDGPVAISSMWARQLTSGSDPLCVGNVQHCTAAGVQQQVWWCILISCVWKCCGSSIVARLCATARLYSRARGTSGGGGCKDPGGQALFCCVSSGMCMEAEQDSV